MRVAHAPATDWNSLQLAVVDAVAGRAALAGVKARQREEPDDIAGRSSEVRSDELQTGLEVRKQEEELRILAMATQAARLIGDYAGVRDLERECAEKSATSSGSSTLSVPSIADIRAITLETTVGKRLSVASVGSSPAQVPAAAQDMERGPMSADDMQAALFKSAEEDSEMPPPPVCPVTRAKPRRDFMPGECVLRKPHTLVGGDDTLVYVVTSVMRPDKDLPVEDFVPSMMLKSVVDGGAPHKVPCALYKRLCECQVLALAHL